MADQGQMFVKETSCDSCTTGCDDSTIKSSHGKASYGASPRLERDCSGLLGLGRTQTAATLLHSIFREKTSGASAYVCLPRRPSMNRDYIE
ncbi:hypothetical protein Bca4012_090356 [Brassica carinata]